MKKITLLLFTLLSMTVNAQRVDKPGEPYDVYCIMRGLDTQYESSPSIYIAGKVHFEDMLDEQDKKLKFRNQADGLTYMAKRGWIFIRHLNSVTSSDCLLKKTVKSDEEALDGLNVTENLKKKKKDKE